MKQLLFFLFLPLLSFCSPKLLIKFYVSDDYKAFVSTYKEYVSMLSENSATTISIVFDVDDKTREKISKDFSFSPKTSVHFAHYESKVEGLNDLSLIHDEFDVILYGHCFYYPVVKNYDQIIVSKMEEIAPNFDKVLHFSASPIKDINVMGVAGKEYIHKHPSFYNTSYKKYFFDFEMTLVTKLTRSSHFVSQKLFAFFPSSGKIMQQWQFTDIRYAPFDENLKRDFETLVSRFCRGFYLEKPKDKPFTLLSSQLLFPSKQQPLWSILIPTVCGREKVFHRLVSSLILQMLITQQTENIEIVFCLDNCEMNIGDKRNLLLEEAEGEYVSFIDDDDEVSLDYISSISKCLEKKPDMVEIVLLKENVPSKFNKSYLGSTHIEKFHKEGFQTSYVSHLNPMKKSIALQAKFPKLDYAEDLRWAHNILKSGLIKTKESFLKPCYFYHFNPNTSLTYKKS